MNNYSLLSRSYDFRGIYGVEMDEDFYYRLGYALSTHTRARTIMIGYDARLSSLSLHDAFVAGASEAGSRLVSIGLCSSDMLSYGTCSSDDIDVGVMITASHNPKEYNGLKSLSHSGEPIDLKTEGVEIAKIMESMAVGHSESPMNTNTEKHYETRDITDAWVDHILSFSQEKNFSGMKIICDAGNGAAGAFLDSFAQKAGFEMIPLFLDPDGNFPHHHPNPMLAENREDARKAVLEVGADLALLFDGDADRCVILDEKGEMIISGIISTIIAESLLQKYPGKTICGNAVISHTVQDFVESHGGVYIREKVGHVYIKNRMKADPNIIFAGEHSSHFFLQSNWNADSGVIAAMIFLDLLKSSGLSTSTFTQKYRRYITLEETNFTVKNPKSVISTLSEIYREEMQDSMDGLTISYPDGSWWNFRPSSNEPLLRLNMEARTQERFDELKGILEEKIGSFN